MSDDEFLNAFEQLGLPFEQWTHRAHVKIAWIYLNRNPFDEALRKMRTGIQAFNARHKVQETATSGYNETTTRAFLHLIAATMCAYAATHPTVSADAFCDTHPQLMNKHALRLFYSPQRRMHPLAKTQFIEPDLTALPRLSPNHPTGRNPPDGAPS